MDIHARYFERYGYCTIPVLSQEESALLTTNALQDTFSMLFMDEPEPILPISDNLKVLVDINYRKEILTNPNCIWRNGNSRQPIISKNNGMVNMYLSDWALALRLDPRIINPIRHLYGQNNIGYTHGLDRFSIKVKGATDMPKHIDRHPTIDMDEGLTRVQALVCSSIDTSFNLRNSGTIEVIPRYHRYWPLIGRIFQILYPEPGQISDRLPWPWDDKDTLLPYINTYLSEYTLCYSGERPDEIDPITQSLLDQLEDTLIEVPDTFRPLSWEPIPCFPGSLICFDSRLPHRNLRNKSSIPRVAHYISLYPIADDYYGSDQHNTVLRYLTTGKIGSLNQGTNRANIEERK